MRGGFWLGSLIVATGAVRLYAGCAPADDGARSPASPASASPVGSCPHVELQPWSACVPWPTVATTETTEPTDGGVRCTWSDVTEPGIDEAMGPNRQPGVMWAGAPDQIYVATSSVISGGTAGIAHLDGTRWTREELPTTASSIFSLWGTPGGDVWATTGRSSTSAPTSTAQCDGPVFRRANGIWRAEPFVDTGNGNGPIVTGLDDDHVVVFASSDVGSRAFRRCGEGWAEISRRTSRRAGVFSVAGAARIDQAHVLSFGGGIDVDSRELLAYVDVFDGTSLDAIDIPVALSDIAAISGSSLNDLYVVGLNRNIDGTLRLFHVTDTLKTWLPLAVSDSLTMGYLSPPMFGTVFGLGCDWPNKYASPTPDCTRFGSLSPNGPFEPKPIDGDGGGGGFGSPGIVAADPNQNIHLLAPPGGNAGAIVTEWRHQRAHCERVAAP